MTRPLRSIRPLRPLRSNRRHPSLAWTLLAALPIGALLAHGEPLARGDAPPGLAAPTVDVDAIPDDRRYDQAAYLTAHNAYASTAERWVYAQQSLSITQQLDYGVRALMLDLHKDCTDKVRKAEQRCEKVTRQDCKKSERRCEKKTKRDCGKLPKGPLRKACEKITETICDGGDLVCRNIDDVVCAPVSGAAEVVESVCEPDAMLCHNNCLLSKTTLKPVGALQKLESALREIGDFLRRRPAAVVTLNLESKVGDPALVRRAFERSGTLPLVYDPADRGAAPVDRGAGWPTLGWMRANNKRLVVLSSAQGDTATPGVQFIWDTTLETQYNLEKYPGCELRSQTTGNVLKPWITLFTLNHFYDSSLPGVPGTPRDLPLRDFGKVNSRSAIEPRIERCRAEVGRLPNFLALDFVEQGEGRALVAALNRRPASDWAR